MATVNPPRGMRDILPADKARRESLLAIIRERYRAHGFDEIETPAVEEYARLHAGIGGDNEKLSYNILRRGLDAEAIEAIGRAIGQAADDMAQLSDLGLRYDLTVPLARFYASNRGQLPTVFRAIQIGPVWRAERPQKGRYRQFMQCDIDIMGDDSARAEAELMVASLDALAALGLDGATVRVNDRRVLDWMLDTFGFTADERPGVLITIDKLDKIGPDGIVAELRERGATASAVDAFDAYLRRPQTMEHRPYGEGQIRKALPENAPDEIVAHLVGIGEAVAAGTEAADIPLVFDPFLVRGMGYYTGTIFELAHPSVPYSLGGGGRYDGMIGRFLGQQIPAVGFSLDSSVSPICSSPWQMPAAGPSSSSTTPTCPWPSSSPTSLRLWRTDASGWSVGRRTSRPFSSGPPRTATTPSQRCRPAPSPGRWSSSPSAEPGRAHPVHTRQPGSHLSAETPDPHWRP